MLSGVPSPDAGDPAKYEYLGWENVDWKGLGYKMPEKVLAAFADHMTKFSYDGPRKFESH